MAVTLEDLQRLFSDAAAIQEKIDELGAPVAAERRALDARERELLGPHHERLVAVENKIKAAKRDLKDYARGLGGTKLPGGLSVSVSKPKTITVVDFEEAVVTHQGLQWLYLTFAGYDTSKPLDELMADWLFTQVREQRFPEDEFERITHKRQLATPSVSFTFTPPEENK